jgi:hypothetical protein
MPNASTTAEYASAMRHLKLSGFGAVAATNGLPLFEEAAVSAIMQSR